MPYKSAPVAVTVDVIFDDRLADAAQMHWGKKLTYLITPKSGPLRSMETLLDANHAISKDLPMAMLRLPHWYEAGKLLVMAAESGIEIDIKLATHKLLIAVETEGWMSRPSRRV